MLSKIIALIFGLIVISKTWTDYKKKKVLRMPAISESKMPTEILLSF